MINGVSGQAGLPAEGLLGARRLLIGVIDINDGLPLAVALLSPKDDELTGRFRGLSLAILGAEHVGAALVCQVAGSGHLDLGRRLVGGKTRGGEVLSPKPASLIRGGCGGAPRGQVLGVGRIKGQSPLEVFFGNGVEPSIRLRLNGLRFGLDVRRADGALLRVTRSQSSEEPRRHAHSAENFEFHDEYQAGCC